MMRTFLLAILCAAAAAAPAQAEQHWGRSRITSIAAVTSDQKYPQYSNTIFVGLADPSWLPAKCRKMPGLLASDKATSLLMLAEAAFRSGRKVVLKADDEAMIGEYCTVFQITAYTKDAK